MNLFDKSNRETYNFNNGITRNIDPTKKSLLQNASNSTKIQM